MSAAAIKTPCIGHCSTVFGDGVCRGCLRYVHEVIDWNRYSEDHKNVIWQRLERQIMQVLPRYVSIHDPRLIDEAVERHRLPYRSANPWHNVYNLLRYAERRQVELGPCGFRVGPEGIVAINRQIYALAQALYERDFLRAGLIPGEVGFRD